MNPRLFCREQSFHKALLLTYSFDPIFFEQVVLPDLWAGRSSDILVLGDQTQINTSISIATGQLRQLGKRYLLAGAKHTGAFHPKVILRLGQKDGVIMVGSGNVTSSGWGGNQEVATEWKMGPDQPDKGSWIHGFLDDVMSWCSSDLELEAVRRMKDVPWLSMTSTSLNQESSIVYSRQGRALAPELAKRWVGRRFDEVKILTGSTDESGAFLRWAHTTFGVKRATVVLTPSSASFDHTQLSNLPLDLNIIIAPSDRPLHAKLYWFDGPSGPAAVMGSANCSAAAWLLPPDRGGNIETIVSYDEPQEADFNETLTLFSNPTYSPIEIFTTPNIDLNKMRVSKDEFELISLRWDSTTHCLKAEITPPPTSEMTVDLMLGGNKLRMDRGDHQADFWQCYISEGIGPTTTFASAIITKESRIWNTSIRWINDLSELVNASQSVRLLEPFKGLERTGTLAEQRLMLAELNEVAQSLFNDVSSLRDPAFSFDRKGKLKSEKESIIPVNPNDLICHLVESTNSFSNYESTRPGSLSLTGILQLLFESEANKEADNYASQDEQIDEGQISDVRENLIANKVLDKGKKQQEASQIDNSLKERLAAQINTFLVELSTSRFSEQCTATQMIQAVSFPLVVALRGQHSGWVTSANSGKWFLEVFSILFRASGNGTNGLLQQVEMRYTKNGMKSIFEEVIGDGALWLVLVATIGNLELQEVGADIEKALMLRDVFNAPQLIQSAQPGNISSLLGKIKIDNANSYIRKVAPEIYQLLNEIESQLKQIWTAELYKQTSQSIVHKAGDLLWRENVGWAVCLVDSNNKEAQYIKVRLQGLAKNVRSDFYINVTYLGMSNNAIFQFVEKLRRTIQME